ncbi:hypothetical protein B0H14DRAFT_2654348 [Mycena olivaceomarginata]|nr:hypothetical protein B0H14DRAFT_2654348 [Mycena olivaceomarginata]
MVKDPEPACALKSAPSSRSRKDISGHVITEDSPAPEDAPEPAVLAAIKDPPSELSCNSSASVAAVPRTLSASSADEPAFVVMHKDAEERDVEPGRLEKDAKETDQRCCSLTEEACTLDLVKLASSSSSITPSPGCRSSTVPSSVSLPSPTSDMSRPEEAHMLSASSTDELVSVLVPDDIKNRDVELGGPQKVMPVIDEPRVVSKEEALTLDSVKRANSYTLEHASSRVSSLGFSSSTGAPVLASIMASLDFALVSAILQTFTTAHLDSSSVRDGALCRVWEREGIGTCPWN